MSDEWIITRRPQVGDEWEFLTPSGSKTRKRIKRIEWLPRRLVPHKWGMFITWSHTPKARYLPMKRVRNLLGEWKCGSARLIETESMRNARIDARMNSKG